MLCISRKGKNDLEGDSQIIRDATPITGLACTVPWWQVCLNPGFKGEIRAQQSWVCGTILPKEVGIRVPLNVPGGWSINTKKIYAQALRSNGIGLMRFWTCFGIVTPVFLPMSPFGMEMSVFCLSHHCILEAHNLFSFMVASGWIISRVSPKSVRWCLDETLDLRI